MSDETETKPWDHGADYYDTSDDCERLTHEDLDECLEDHFENTPGLVSEVVAKGVTVYAWRRDALDAVAEASRSADNAIENMSEVFSDEYGDPNGSDEIFSDEAEAECKAAIMPALVKLLKSAKVWRCSVIGKRTFTADELLAWVKQHNPEWLENKS